MLFVQILGSNEQPGQVPGRLHHQHHSSPCSSLSLRFHCSASWDPTFQRQVPEQFKKQLWRDGRQHSHRLSGQNPPIWQSFNPIQYFRSKSSNLASSLLFPDSHRRGLAPHHVWWDRCCGWSQQLGCIRQSLLCSSLHLRFFPCCPF